MESKVCSRSQGQPSGARSRAMMEIARPSGSPPGSGCCAGRAGTAIRPLYPIRRFPVRDLAPLQYAGHEMTSTDKTPPAPKKRMSRWTLLLILPYLGLCFPQIYARATPALLGFPFFYWYQFAWVVLASLIMGLVYRKSDY